MKNPDQITVFALRINGLIDPGLFNSLIERVDRDKQERIKKFSRQEDAQRCLFADLLLRTALFELFGLKSIDIRFSISESGKPAIVGASHSHFNISHSGEWVVCVIDRFAVGIDIEAVRDIDLSVAEIFFDAREYDHIINAKNPGETFFEYWTLKESYTKFTGMGILEPLNSFVIKLSGDNQTSIKVAGETLNDVYFRQYTACQGYKIAVCASHPHFREDVIEYNLQDIISDVRYLP